MIRRQMRDFDSTLIDVSAKTQRLRTIMSQYEEHVEKLYPQWKEQVLAEAMRKRDKVSIFTMY